MKFARYTFLMAGIYGLIALIPQYFLEDKTGREYPPAITHPEFYYGFTGVALAFQIVFFIIARDPVRYRQMMIPSMIEKFSFGLAVYPLFALGRVAAPMVGAATIDLILGMLFITAFIKVKTEDS